MDIQNGSVGEYGYLETRTSNRLVAVSLEQDLLPSEDRSAEAVEVTAQIDLMTSGDLIEGRRPRQLSRRIRVAVVPHPGDYLALSGAETVVFVEVTDVAGTADDPAGILVSACAPRRDTGTILAPEGWQPSRASYPEKTVARKLLVDTGRNGDISIITVTE